MQKLSKGPSFTHLCFSCMFQNLLIKTVWLTAQTVFVYNFAELRKIRIHKTSTVHCTTIPNREVQGFTGKPCNENRFFLVRIDLQGVLCKPYRVWVYSVVDWQKTVSMCKTVLNWFSFFLVFLKSSLWKDLFYAFTLEVICQDIPVFTKGKGRAWGWNDKATHRKARPEAIFFLLWKILKWQKKNIHLSQWSLLVVVNIK